MLHKLSIVFLALVSSGALRADSLICKGQNWAYKFDIDGSVCKHEQKVIKDIPGVYKKGHVNNFDKMTAEECWKSLAKIQMDNAKCCDNGSDSEVTTRCITKKLSY